MAMERPTFFTTVWRTLRQLTTTKGFSIKQIAKHLRQLRSKRNPKDIHSIVEQSLRYGVQKKILLEKCGKFHLSASKLQFILNQAASEKKKKKRVRFKKGKTNINDALKNSQRSSERQKSRKTSRNSRRSVKSRSSHRSRKRNENKNIETSSDESKDTTNNERPTQKKSNSKLIVEKTNSEESLNVTPEKDVHENCVNKNKIRNKQANITQPPRLESEIDIGWHPPRPQSKIIRKTQSRPKVRKSQNKKYKYHSSHRMDRRKHLKDFIPDDKSCRRCETRSRHNRDLETSEGSSGYDSSSKESICRKCHHHNCSKHCHRSLCNSNNNLLERKMSNTILDHLNKSKTELDETGGKKLTPFEVFLGASQQLETIMENASSDEDAPPEDIEKKPEDTFDMSYIN